MRFGEYGTSNQIILKKSVIARVIGLKQMTVHYWIKKYLANGNHFPMENNRYVHPRKLQHEHVNYIISTRTLQEWREYSLVDRCIKIMDKFGVNISRTTLAKTYKSHGIRYRKPGYAYYSKELPIHKLQEQQKFVVRLVKYM